MTTTQAVWDLTTLPIGDYPFGDSYAVPLSECPYCHRVGQQYTEWDSDMWLHVISQMTDDGGETAYGPVWISEYCNVKDDTWVISEPAATMRGKSLAERLAELKEKT